MYSRGVLKTHTPSHIAAVFENSPEGFFENRFYIYSQYLRWFYEIVHGYCPVRVGDCVLLNYERAGLKNIKAKVISQSINCGIGCTVEETAVFVKWRTSGRER